MPRPVRVGPLAVDLVRRTVAVGGMTGRLTGAGLGLLCLLAANAGRVLTREEVHAALWPAEARPGSNAVDRGVLALRRWLDRDPARRWVMETVPGRGYRFAARQS